MTEHPATAGLQETGEPLAVKFLIRLRDDQLREVAAAVPLRGSTVLARCLDCNRPLTEVSREEARERVPAYVWSTQTDFRGCTGCGRIYWGATHREHMLSELATLGLAPEVRPSA